jgi:hypothetical protein
MFESRKVVLVVDDEESLSPEVQTEKVPIDAAALHLVAPEEAIRVFDAEIGSGAAWKSPLMQYRTTSGFQVDWKVEVGNWLERARRLGFLDHVRRTIVPRQQAAGDRAAGDAVHQNVTQQLAQAQALHYFVGTGWTFHAWEPMVFENRGSGTRADVDFQLVAPTGPLVDFQVKASGRLGLRDNEVDDHIQKGVQNAATRSTSRPCAASWRRASSSRAGSRLARRARPRAGSRGFERQGELAGALALWQQAIVIDQTNPTPRLRKAQALTARGAERRGDTLLAEIAHRAWHERWNGVAEQARELLERGKHAR